MSTAKDLAHAMTARMAEVTIANGFATDIGGRVFRGRRKIDEQHVPCVVIVEADDNVSDSKRGQVKLAQDYIIEGHCQCDPDNPNDAALDMIADIKRAIWGADLTFSGLVRDVDYVGRIVSPREDGLSIVSAGVRLSLTFVETLATP